MDYLSFYQEKHTYLQNLDNRLKTIVSIVNKSNKILDIGCGNGLLINELKKKFPNKNIIIHGCDVYPNNKYNFPYYQCDITKGLSFNRDKYDLIILGEVIEHVPDPDFVLYEIRKKLKPNGKLIITTPNLASWINRVLLLLGIQPLYTETSTTMKLGRFFHILGQGNKTEGHLKIFTYKSLEEILILNRFRIEKKLGTTFFFSFPISLIDRLCSYIIPISSGLIYVASKT